MRAILIDCRNFLIINRNAYYLCKSLYAKSIIGWINEEGLKIKIRKGKMVVSFRMVYSPISITNYKKVDDVELLELGCSF